MSDMDFVMVPVKTLILMRRAITEDAPYGKDAIASYEKLKSEWTFKNLVFQFEFFDFYARLISNNII